MGPNEESEEFLSLLIKFLISIISLKALHIVFVIPTVFSHCVVATQHPWPQFGKAKDTGRKQLTRHQTSLRISYASDVIAYACKDRNVLQGGVESQWVKVCCLTAFGG